MNLRSLIIDIKSKLPESSKDVSLVFTGNVLSKSMTFLITILFLRYISPSDYRLYGLFITVLATVIKLTDSGLHQSFIKFYSLYRVSDPLRAETHFSFALRIKGVLISVCAVLLYFNSDFLAIDVMKTPELAVAFKIMAGAVVGGGIVEFLLAVYQAKRQFKCYALVRILEGVGKIGAISISILLGGFSLLLVYEVYAGIPLLLGLTGLLLILKTDGGVRDRWRENGKEIFTFGKWLFLSSLATLFIYRVDILMIVPMLSDTPAEAGLYVAANKLCTPLLVFAASVSTVLFPRAMELRSIADMKRYIKSAFQLIAAVSLLAIAYAVVLFLITPMAFPQYTEAIPLFAILFFGYLWLIVSSPFTILILSLGRSDIEALLNLLMLAVIIASHYLFISYFGAVGAAVSTVLIWVAGGSATLVYVYRNRFLIEKGE